MVRSSVIGTGFAVAALVAFQVTGCTGGDGGGGAGTSGTSHGGTTGSAGTTGAAGTSGEAGTSGGAGTTGSAGSTATGSAGSSGTTGSAGTTGAAGTTGTGGTGTVDPSCPASITDKSTTCTTEGLACPKTCGVESKGSKTCTCTAGVFVCESVAPSCHYPAGTDLTCYHLPTPVPACPTGTISNAACTTAACMPCSGYQDSSMAAKTGYCVCVASKWKCASDKEWPAQ